MLSTTYAIQGFLYFLAHPSLWLVAICPFLLVILCSIGGTLALFIAAYPAQAFALIKWAQWSPAAAWSLAFFITLLEAALMSLILFAALPPAYLDVIFRKVLLMRGGKSAELLRRQAEGENVEASCATNCGACFRVSILVRIFVAIVTFPLHAIPVLGTLAWIWLNGIVMLWEYHQSWFSLYRISYPGQKKYIKQNWSTYWAAGMLAQTLEMIPLLNWVFCWSNAVGAALMVADLEAEGRLPAPFPETPSSGDLPSGSEAGQPPGMQHADSQERLYGATGRPAGQAWSGRG